MAPRSLGDGGSSAPRGDVVGERVRPRELQQCRAACRRRAVREGADGARVPDAAGEKAEREVGPGPGARAGAGHGEGAVRAACDRHGRCPGSVS